MRVYEAYTFDHRLLDHAEGGHGMRIHTRSLAELRRHVRELSQPALEADGAEPVEWKGACYELGPVTVRLVMRVLEQRGYIQKTLARYRMIVRHAGVSCTRLEPATRG